MDLTNILLLLISTGLGVVIQILFNISKKVNGVDVKVSVITVKQENTQKQVDEHSQILKHIKPKTA